MPSPFAVPNEVRRLAVAGAFVALLVLAAGFAFELARYGRDDRAAFTRVEQQVRRELETMSTDLRQRAAAIAGDRERLARAAAGDEAATTALFAAIDGADPARNTRVALTVYGPACDTVTCAAVAWSEGPAEDLPEDRVMGPEALFAVRGTLGLRLVYITPIAAPDGRRIGAVAAERILVPVLGVQSTEAPELASTLAPVSLLTRSEGAGEATAPNTFVIHARTGEVLLQGHVDPAALSAARDRYRRGVLGVAGIVLALTLTLLIGPLLDARQHAWNASRAVRLTLLGLLLVAAARYIAWLSVPQFWKSGRGFDLFATGAMLLGMAALVAPLVGALPLVLRRRRKRGRRALEVTALYLGPFLAGILALLPVAAYAFLLSALSQDPAVDLVDYAIYPLTGARILLLLGIVLIGAATMWTAVLVLTSSLHLQRYSPSALRKFAPWFAWLLPAIAVFGISLESQPVGAHVVPVALAVVATLLGRRARRYYSHASHATRLLAIWLLLLLPALALYPIALFYAVRGQRQAIEQEYSPRTSDHTSELQGQLTATLDRIDRLPNLQLLMGGACGQGPQAAFYVWDSTPLGDDRLTSAVELYGADGCLVSRFALNLPEVGADTQRNVSLACRWEVFGEVNRFGSEERRMLHAERALCGDGDQKHGTIVVHLMPDYRALPFIASANPYLEVLRGGAVTKRPVEDLQVAIYGWGRSPIFSTAASPWQLQEDVFDRLYRSREPFWTRVSQPGGSWNVYFRNDRAGIYALGYPQPTIFDHLVHGAELTTLAGIAWLLILAGAALFLPLARRRMNVGRVLLREIRTSFYRKLLLAFVAASIVPVIILALVLRAYTAGLLREDVEEEASRTVAVAQRSIENYYAAQQSAHTVDISDDLMVQLSQILSQDINVFEGPRLVATSVRDLFASGLLPTRTPAQIYRKIAIERLPGYVGEERIGDFRYLLAATSARTDKDVILSVPLATRSNEIEREIEDLDRGIHLAAILFILLGSALGLYMAERIADPVRRLTRATRRIASGDLDARIAIRTADELRRLVDDFNRMAEELKAQRDELERTHRLAAWAEMARQVAHEIKNPLTPIQLSAEHLRRVHADRGEPMSPVLEHCVDSILSQVKLLRQISSEFSAFASSPTVKPTVVEPGELVGEMVAPYRAGLPERIQMSLDIEANLPRVRADRALLGRAVTNLIENALHAMPEGGRVAISVRHEGGEVVIAVADTGVGMDQEALERAFEPYFSTKATGTGLGLPIARRNVELNGGTIAVESTKGAGTTVTVRLPVTTASF